MNEENDYVIANLHEALKERDAEIVRLHGRLSRKLCRGEWDEALATWTMMHQVVSLSLAASGGATIGIAIGWWFL